MITHSPEDQELLEQIQQMNKDRFTPKKVSMWKRIKVRIVKWLVKKLDA